MIGLLGSLGAIGTGTLLGGIAGYQKDKSSSQYGLNIAGPSELETQGLGYLQSAGGQLSSMLQTGPGAQDINNAYGAQTGLADMLKQLEQSGGVPGQGDIDTGNTLASKLFAARRTALGQSFEDQLTQANRQAALMGRSMNDPILRAKLAQEQTRQSSLLDAEQGGFATQYAMGLPGQRLGFAQQRVGVLGGLASQALANRQALAALGEGIMNNERQFRLNTATKYGNQESGGGLKGAITGMFGGAQAGMSLAQSATGLGSFGGMGAGSPMSFGGQTLNPFMMSQLSTQALPANYYRGPVT